MPVRLPALLAASATLLAAAPALAERRPLVVRVPECPGPLCPPRDAAGAPVAAAQGKRLVWLAFDGVDLTRSSNSDDAPSGRSAIVSRSMTVPRFEPGDLSDSGGKSRQAIIDLTVAEIESIYSPFDVDFVTDRPAAGPYSAIVFGGSCGSVTGISGCGGIALLDCGESMPSNITFVFTVGLHYRDLAPTAAQESAHAFGLAHTDNESDVMYPFLLPGNYPDHFGDSDATCPPNEVQQGQTCGRTSQNSHDALLSIIGRRRAALGEICNSGTECASEQCGELDGDKRCTRTCSDEAVCPDGFSCRGGDDGSCWPGDAGGDDGGGCGCHAGGGGGVPALVLLGLGLAAAARRRRGHRPSA